MADLNICTMIGRLGKEPDIRMTTTGKKVANFSIGVSRVPVEGRTETDWIPCVIWGNTAEFVERYVHKGNRVCISGRWQVRSYTDANGNGHMVSELVGREFQLLESKPKEERKVSEEPTLGVTRDDLPPFEVMDDDLPF